MNRVQPPVIENCLTDKFFHFPSSVIGHNHPLIIVIIFMIIMVIIILDHDHQYDYPPPAALYVPGSDGKPCRWLPHPGSHDHDGDGSPGPRI